MYKYNWHITKIIYHMTTYINYTVEPNYLEAHRWCNTVSMLTMYAVDCGFKPN
jgi:hypothetical protein